MYTILINMHRFAQLHLEFSLVLACVSSSLSSIIHPKSESPILFLSYVNKEKCHPIFWKAFLELHKFFLNFFLNTDSFTSTSNKRLISKFKSLPKISTCLGRTRHQAKKFQNLLPSEFLEVFPETTQMLPNIFLNTSRLRVAITRNLAHGSRAQAYTLL